jgi:MSHA pilin protein MshA
MNSSKLRGFTLIELVVVITILGILAAFAVPKFIALDSQARTVTINGLAGSVKSAASLARGLAMATGATANVAMEGATVGLLNNYPDPSATGIGNAVNVNVTANTGDFIFTPAAATGGIASWTKNGASATAIANGTCTVTYASAAVGATPVVTATTTGC